VTLAEVRYRTSIQPGVQESFAAMFPAPRQRWVDAMITADDELAALTEPTLVVHGREDEVIPLENSLRLMRSSPTFSCTCSAAADTGLRSSMRASSTASWASSWPAASRDRPLPVPRSLGEVGPAARLGRWCCRGRSRWSRSVRATRHRTNVLDP
jgi:hypothetical protein